MENLINLDIIKKNEGLLKSTIFTAIQINILKKRLPNKRLNNNERTYYYKFIKPKVYAMMKFFNITENIMGKDFIIDERIARASNIIRSLEKKHKNKKIILSGSFLFNKKYNDIDVFVFTKYEKEDYKKGRLHVSFLPESAIDSLFFSSLSKISVLNFSFNAKEDFDIGLNDVLQTYELLINAIINKEDYEKYLRDFILQTEYISKKVILNPKQLYDMKETLLTKDIKVLSNTFINALTLSNKDIKETLEQQLKEYKKLSKEYKKAKNLGIYIDTYSKVIELAS